MSTRSEHRELQGRTVLITGATAGIGYETTRLLARRGADRIITGRDAGRAEEAVATIQRESGVGSVDFIRADHSTVGGNELLAGQVSPARTSAHARDCDDAVGGVESASADDFDADRFHGLARVPLAGDEALRAVPVQMDAAFMKASSQRFRVRQRRDW
jgi:NAD(P)-dependent dehydrogenase (short-subunit alcohol dehydrogenase family)